MIIRSLKIAHFGKFKDTSFHFDEGINIITGENESGKTTIASFILGMLYGIPESSKLYERYLPYEEDGVFGGSMTVSDDENTYRIDRSFSEGTLSVKRITDEKEEDVENPEETLKMLLNGVLEEDYLSTGFMSQDAFREDDIRFRKTEEKTARKKTEDEIRKSFEESRKHLLIKQEELRSGLDENLNLRTEKAEKEYQDNEDRISELARLIKTTGDIRDGEETSLKEDIDKADRVNKNREDGYLNEVKEADKALENAVKRQEEARKVMSFNGLIPLIIGAVIALACGIYAYLKAFTWETLKADRLSLALLISGGILSIFLLVTGIVQIIRKKKTDDVLRASITEVEDMERNKIDAEKAYKEYLIHKTETDVKAENREAREAHIQELSEEISRYQKEKDDREIKTADYSSALSALWVQKSSQDEVKEDIEALAIALKAMEEAENLTDTGENLSHKATDYLTRMYEGTSEEIQVEPEDMIHVMKNGRDIDVGSLSTAAAQEVLLSVRLSRLDEKDEEQAMPIVLDDIFANFDVDRLYAGMQLIKSIQRQVILLTCQNREREAL